MVDGGRVSVVDGGEGLAGLATTGLAGFAGFAGPTLAYFVGRVPTPPPSVDKDESGVGSLLASSGFRKQVSDKIIIIVSCLTSGVGVGVGLAAASTPPFGLGGLRLCGESGEGRRAGTGGSVRVEGGEDEGASGRVGEGREVG